MQRDRRQQNRIAFLVAGLTVALGSLGGGPAAGALPLRDGGAGRGLGLANVQVSHDSFAAHAEPSLAVDPRDPRVLLGAAMFIRGPRVVAGAFSSADSGRTWRDHGPLAMPPGATYSGDVTVAFDAHGAGFVSSLVQMSDGDGVYVWRTDDEGRSFHGPVAVMRGPFADHPGLAVDDTPGAGGELYVAWRTRAGLAFSRSVDGGRHFAAPRLIVPGDEIYLPVVAAGPDGAVYLAYEEIAQGPAARLVVVSSADHGRRFGAPSALGPMVDTLSPAPGVVLPTGPSVAVDPRSGAVYVAYVAGQGGVLLAQSHDGGRTWGGPVHVPVEPGGGAVAFQPHVVVDGAGGVDLTALILAHGRVALHLIRSTTRGAGFESPRAITNRPFDPALGVISAGKGNQGSYWWIGDYQGLATGDDTIYPCWSDTRSGRLQIVTAAVPLTWAEGRRQKAVGNWQLATAF